MLPLAIAVLALACRPGGARSGAEPPANQADPPAARDIRIVHVGNAGFLVVVDGKKVLIDALFSLPSPAEPPPEVLERLETGRAPFDGIDLILATHVDRDHFRAESVLRALAHNPDAVFLSTPQVVSRLRVRSADFAPVQDRIRTLDLPIDSGADVMIRGLRVRVMSTGHGSVPSAMRNYMYLVSSASGGFFHEGDGEVERPFGLHDFGPDSIDVAFVQYARFVRPVALRPIEAVVRPRHLIPMHIWARRRGDADARLGPVTRTRPDVHYLREAMASITVATR